METPLLASLREPPIVGEFYMVPTVRYRHHGWTRDWPVLGPIHDDAADLNFPHLHYHFDGRFMSPQVLRSITAIGRSPELTLNGSVLVEPTDLATDQYAQRAYGHLPRRPVLRRRKCYRDTQPYLDEARRMIAKRVGSDAITERYGPIAEPIRAKGGRLLCPHRKVDLSSFAPDADGIVTCPLHGLRVRCPTNFPTPTGGYGISARPVPSERVELAARPLGRGRFAPFHTSED